MILRISALYDLTVQFFQLMLDFLGTPDLFVQIPLSDIDAVLHKHGAALMEIKLKDNVK